MKQKLARMAVRYRKAPAMDTIVGLLERLRLKSAITRALFQGDNARRPPIGSGEAAAAVARVDFRLRAIASSGKRIVVGPWLSEVGFELLYWRPFLIWLVEHYHIDPRRVTVISRGGVRGWYAGIAEKYIDVFDTYTPDEFRRLNEARWQDNAGLQKHTSISKFDDLILNRLMPQSDDYDLLHPELMYFLFDDYWSGRAGAERFTNHTKFKSLKKVPHPILSTLPEQFTAVKFYARPSFPMTSETSDFVKTFVLSLADKGAVVSLSTGLRADDHSEFEMPSHPNIHHIGDSLTARHNLEIQSAVISASKHIFCTYGGFSYLPLLYSVPTTGLYSVDKHFMRIHGNAAYLLSSKSKTPLSVTHIDAFKSQW